MSLDLSQKLAEAKDNLRECEETLDTLKQNFVDQVASQKTLIKLAKKNVLDYEKLIEKAKQLEK